LIITINNDKVGYQMSNTCKFNTMRDRQTVYVLSYLDQAHEYIVAHTECATRYFTNMPHIYYDISCTNTGTVICLSNLDDGQYHTIFDEIESDKATYSLYGLVCQSLTCTRNGIDMNFYGVIIARKHKILTDIYIEKIRKLFDTHDINGITLERFNEFSDLLRGLPSNLRGNPSNTPLFT